MAIVDRVSNTHPPKERRRTRHGHGWLTGAIGIALSIMLLAVLPRFSAIAGSIAALIVLHILGFTVAAGTTYAWFARAVGQRIHRHAGGAHAADGIDFGWSVSMDWGLWLVAIALVAIAMACSVQYPQAWPAWLVVGGQGVAFGIGGVLMRQSRRADIAVLPLVRIFSGSSDRILDAGCGAGRTSLAIAKASEAGRITAFDRFDAYYIDGGGLDQLRRNLDLAGIADRVEVVSGDLTCMPFPDAHFDTIISSNAIDHLGSDTQAALEELHRTLKPGGRMLLVMWVPGWVTFCVASVACLAMATPDAWLARLDRAGFQVADRGYVNGMWFVVAERPFQSDAR